MNSAALSSTTALPRGGHQPVLGDFDRSKRLKESLIGSKTPKRVEDLTGGRSRGYASTLREAARRTHGAQRILTVSSAGATGRGATNALRNAVGKAAKDGLRKIKLSDLSNNGTREVMTKTLVQWSLLEGINNEVRERIKDLVKDMKFPAKKHVTIIASGLITSAAVASLMVPANRIALQQRTMGMGLRQSVQHYLRSEALTGEMLRRVGREAILSVPVCLVRSYAQEPFDIDPAVAQERRALGLMFAASLQTGFDNADQVESKDNLLPLVGHMAASAAVARVSNEIYTSSKKRLSGLVDKVQGFAQSDGKAGINPQRKESRLFGVRSSGAFKGDVPKKRKSSVDRNVSGNVNVNGNLSVKGNINVKSDLNVDRQR